LLAAFDPCLTVLPVGESGLDTNGNPVMPEFVAGGVVLAFDGAGVPLTLAGGNLATVIVPAGAGCYTNCSDLPGGVVAWTNSLQDGLWRLAGTASPTVNYLGQCAYVESAPVGPFFAAAPNNAPGPFQVTINTDNSINLPALLLVRDSFKKVVASKVLFRGKAADSSLTLNVRKNDTVSPRIAGLREAPGVFYRDVNAFSGSINDAQAVDNNANSPKDEMLFDDIINVMANQTVTLTLNSLKARKANAFNDPGHFLAYLFKTGDPTTALQYYAAIGAITNPAKISGPKDTFGKWLATNGFLNVNNNLVPTASAVYFNAGDLGFGREMNLKTNGDEFAFYVTNYKDADVAASKKGPVATVCMEFSRAADPASAKKVGSPYIKFYVYEHSTNVDLFSSPLVVSADLDGFGQKFVPNLCMVCHGGSRGQLSQIKADVAAGKPGVNGDLATRFIPFDLESFTYPNIDPTTLRAPFKVMNQLIGANVSLPTPAVAELVSNWYGAVGALAKSNFNYDFTPTGWQNNNPDQTLYDNVVKLSCRSCHTTRLSGDDTKSLAFNTAAQFSFKKRIGQVDERVNSTYEMPNAQRTFTIYWGRYNNNVPQYQPNLLNPYIKAAGGP
jgi:hypothetical protein